MMLEAAIERAAAESQRLGRVTHVAAVALERLADEDALDLLQRKILEPARRPTATEPQVRQPHQRALRHQHCPLERVVELAHVTGPCVALERLDRLGLESTERFPIPDGVPPQEVLREGPDVVLALAQRREADLDRVE